MIDKCPKCGGEIQATVPRYLKDVVLDDNGVIIAYQEWDTDTTDIAEIYCENDHEVRPA